MAFFVPSSSRHKENYIRHTYTIFRCSPRGFSATCLQQMQGSVVGENQSRLAGTQTMENVKIYRKIPITSPGALLMVKGPFSPFFLGGGGGLIHGRIFAF